jgi:hypothetical protein
VTERRESLIESSSRIRRHGAVTWHTKCHAWGVTPCKSEGNTPNETYIEVDPTSSGGDVDDPDQWRECGIGIGGGPPYGRHHHQLSPDCKGLGLLNGSFAGFGRSGRRRISAPAAPGSRAQPSAAPPDAVPVPEADGAPATGAKRRPNPAVVLLILARATSKKPPARQIPKQVWRTFAGLSL